MQLKTRNIRLHKTVVLLASNVCNKEEKFNDPNFNLKKTKKQNTLSTNKIFMKENKTLEKVKFVF